MTYYAEIALERALATLNVDYDIRIPLEEQFRYELSFETDGEPPDINYEYEE